MSKLALFLLPILALAQSKSGVGRNATPDEIRQRNLSISPSGAGLPGGQGDARGGKAIYDAECASCHGPKLEGDSQKGYPALAGGQGTIQTPKPLKTVGSYWPHAPGVFDYIHRAMPYDHPRKLSADQVYAVTAYVLYVNSIIGETDVMSAKTLPQVKMPNRDGFIPDTRITKGKKTPAL
ncbi:MAG: cytochrome c [Bryobacteraceae bacterium]|nr:cytochrome c [Bryobacteraceae bacterium]